MWHEARKQERILKSMMVDHRRRAERRRDYYEKTKGDPAQFLQIHGRVAKIHVDPAIAAAAEGAATMMPWQGHHDIMIDRFDVRAHLDIIPSRPRKDDSDSSQGSNDELWEERQASYERYRILVQNEFIAVSEEKFLHQIHAEEQFGPVHKTGEEDKKKMLASKKAAIGFTYEDSTPSGGGVASTSLLSPTMPVEATEEDDSDSDIDLDLSIAVDKLTTEQMHEVNKCALHYGLGKQDFMSLLTRDLDEQESMRMAKEEEQERAMYSGRKARKERRAFREQKLQALLQNRCLSPPSYATRASPTYGQYRRSASASKSRSPSPFEGGIKFITSFGDEESDNDARNAASRPASGRKNDPAPKKNASWAARAKAGASAASTASNVSNDRRLRDKKRSHPLRSRSRSPQDSVSRRRTRSRSRSPRGGTSRRWSRPRDRDRDRDHRSRRRSPSWSKSHSRRSRRSRSRSRSRSRTRSRSRSRTRSRSRSRSQRRRNNRDTSRDKSWKKRSRSSSSSSSTSSSQSSHSKSSSHSHPSSSTTTATSAATTTTTAVPAAAAAIPVLPPRNKSPPAAPPSIPVLTPAPPPPIRRYYGRQKSESSDSSPLSDDDTPPPTKPTAPSSRSTAAVGTSTGATKASTLTPQERLKRKMQAALNKHYKADKRAEKEKLQKVEQERLNREEEMRELALRLRRKERQRRHAMRGGDSDSSSRSTYSRSRSRTPC